MPITVMVSKEEFEKDPTDIKIINNYPGKGDDPLYMKTTHRGLVLALTERNWHDDSDFLAIVWNEETQAPNTIEYGTTRFWTYPNGASVDATPEIVEKYKQYLKNERERIERATVRVGKKVNVLKGKYQGKSGQAFWVGKAKTHHYGVATSRVGIKTEDGEKFFTSLYDVEVNNG